MQLVEKHVINRQHKFWKDCDYLSLQAKHLYNATTYTQRQYFFQTGKYYNNVDIYHATKNLESYRYLPTKVSKQIVRKVSETWKSWLSALKDFKKFPHKYLGRPKIPGYKHKERGRYVVIYPCDAISRPALKKGLIKLSPAVVLRGSQVNICFPTKVKKVDQVRIVPKLNCYVIEVIYTYTQIESKQSPWVAGIDLGLTNLMAITSNQPGLKPLLVNGRPLKSINQFFNKKLATAQSKEAWRQIKQLNHKRDNRVNNYLHTASRRVINWCLKNNISTLIIGNNQGWKQNINIGKLNNQKFTQIPHSRLINLLSYKAKLSGIEVIVTEESYTSKASALDGDKLPKYSPNTKYRFSGKRIKRGLYQTATGKLINADTNGSMNIIRKVIPNVFKGIEGLPFIPVALDLWTLATDIEDYH